MPNNAVKTILDVVSNMQNRPNKTKINHVNDTDIYGKVFQSFQGDPGRATYMHTSVFLVTGQFLVVWSQDPFNALPSPTTSTKHPLNSAEVLRGLLRHESWHTFYKNIASVTEESSVGSFFCCLSYPLLDASLLTGISNFVFLFQEGWAPLLLPPSYFLSLLQ